MQPSHSNIAPLAGLDNPLLSPLLPLLPQLPPDIRAAVPGAFEVPIRAGATDPNKLIKAALVHLRGQMRRPWLPTHQAIRSAILAIIAHPSESLELAMVLLSSWEGGRDG